MSKRQWLCVLGVWVMIFLFLGIPSVWHKIVALISGIVIIAIALRLPAERKSSPVISTSVKSPETPIFVENNTSTPNAQ